MSKILFLTHEKIKVICSSHRVMLCLLYSPKEKIVKFHAQKQIGKSHVIDIFTTSEDMENISLRIFQYLTLYYIIMFIYTGLVLNCSSWRFSKGYPLLLLRRYYSIGGTIN